MNKIFKKIGCVLSSAFIIAAVAGCAQKTTTTLATRTPVVLPDYESMESEEIIIAGWVAPEPTLENYKIYQEAGFNYVFCFGQYAGNVGSKKLEQALDICDQLGIKVFSDVSRNLDAITATIEEYSKHPSFAGYNYDEPVLYKNTLNLSDGIIDGIAPAIEKMHEEYPNVEFLCNLNPTEATAYSWGTPAFTYQEYLDAQTSYINSIYADSDSSVHNWISFDSYPICNNANSDHPYYLKTTWLENLSLIAETKRDSDYKLTSNAFIQAMPYGEANGKYDRVPTYEDIRLQVYTLLAFGYDAISYYCYLTPTSDDDGEFRSYQLAMIDPEGNKTEIYESGKKVNNEIKTLQKAYKQFNGNWIGICPVYGTNNTAEDEFYYNKTIDCLDSPLPVSKLKGVKSIVSNEDIIIGYMKDNSGNPGFMVVNYNDSSWEKTVDAQITFDGYTQARVYIDGEIKTVDLVDHVLDLQLDVGQGAFVIPCA